MYYVYLYIDPRDGIVRYVGKGKGYRINNYRRGKNNRIAHWLNELESLGLKPIAVKYKENLTEPEAFQLEKILISWFGRVKYNSECWKEGDNNGYLLNDCDGGEGVSGKEISETTRKKMEFSAQKRCKNPEYRKKNKIALQKLAQDPEWLRKQKIMTNSPETQAKRRASLKFTNSLPETHIKRCLAAQEINNRPERRLQQSLWSKVAWAKPGAKEKRSAQQKIAQNRPETKAKKSASLKTAFNTPESKAKRSASAKIVQNRPEVRAKKEKGARQGGPRVGKIYKGVSFSKENKKWKAQIKARRKIKHLGYFDTEIEAAQAYNEGVDKYWGGEGYKNPV